MATLKHHVSFIQNIINKGPRSDDSRFSDRLIAHTLKQARARLIKIKLDKYDYIADSNYLSICVSLEEITPNVAYGCLPDPLDCKILRSTCPLPKEIVSKWGSTIQVLTAEGKSLSVITRTTNNYSSYTNTQVNNSTGWSIVDQYLEVYNNAKIRYVIGRGIWEDPEEAVNYCTQSTDCINPTSESFPIDGELVDPMYRITLELLGISNNYPEDNLSDARSVEQRNSLEPNEQRPQ